MKPVRFLPARSLVFTLALAWGPLAFTLAQEPAEDAGLAALSGAQLEWSALPPLPDPQGFGGPVVGITGGQLMVLGGANFPLAPGEDLWTATKVWHPKIYRYPLASGGGGEWVELPPLASPIGYAPVASTRHGIAVLGGERADGPVAEAFLLQWDEAAAELRRRPLPDLPRASAFGAAAVVGDAVYLAGGSETVRLESAMRNFWRLDLAALDRGEAPRWEELEPWPGPARAFNLTVAQRCGEGLRVYVISGRRQREGVEGNEGIEVLPDVYEYDPESGVWRERAPMPRPLNAGGGGALGERQILVLSGDDGSLVTRIDELRDEHPGFPREAWAYDTEGDHWRLAGETPANQATSPVARHGETLYLVSGETRPRVRTRQAWAIRLE